MTNVALYDIAFTSITIPSPGMVISGFQMAEYFTMQVALKHLPVPESAAAFIFCTVAGKRRNCGEYLCSLGRSKLKERLDTTEQLSLPAQCCYDVQVLARS